MNRPILLDAYAARSCPVKTQNEYNPTIAAPLADDDQGLAELFAGSQTFKDQVFTTIIDAQPGSAVADLRDAGSPEQRVAATQAAVAGHTPVIVAPRLPPDLSGHRRGQPDLLLRGVDGYHPVQIKRHRVQEPRVGGETFTWVSPLSSPLPAERAATPVSFRSSREHDLVQMAHYWRMLQAFGWAASEPIAAVIGTDVIAPATELALTWVKLDHKFIRTFSRTAVDGWKRRAPLERYDHEHGFRVKVAQVAEAQDSPHAPREMVSPIVVRECDTCAWWLTCKPALQDDDLSLRISKSPLDVREIAVLRSLGVQTLTDLITTDVDALLPSYLPEVRHRPGAEKRLRLAARRARLMTEGVSLEWVGDEPVSLPEAELEIDFDIETSASDQIYLWGFWVHDRASGLPAHYQGFVRFEDLDATAEADLAEQALGWLEDLLATRPGIVYHYSDYEIVHLAKVAQVRPGGAAERLLKRRAEVFFDLFEVIRDNFFGAHGLGLKMVAEHGPGFHWRDDDPSGLNSQAWFRDAVQHTDPMVRSESARRVLEYNEDDVRATAALREWLRTKHSAPTSTAVGAS